MGSPDVCNVPAAPNPVPTPFPNTAMLSNATATSTKVAIENMDAVMLTSKIPSSMGDQAGCLGGVVSGLVGGEVVFRKGSSKVFVEGKPIVTHTATTGHNGTNSNVPGVFSVAGQTKVFCAP